jgi:hypothetical protein
MANLWMAVAADMGTSLIVILYGMRLITTKWTPPPLKGLSEVEHGGGRSHLQKDCGCSH